MDEKSSILDPEEPQNYFDPKEYLTKVIKIENEESEGSSDNEDDSKEDKRILTLITLLTDPAHKSIREETLISLKKENKGELLLLAIASDASKDKRDKLIAACWESEIDFSKYLPFFILLSLDDDYLVSLEAMTVISNMSGPFESEKIKEGINKVKEKQRKISSERAVLLNDLIYTLEGFIS